MTLHDDQLEAEIAAVTERIARLSRPAKSPKSGRRSPGSRVPATTTAQNRHLKLLGSAAIGGLSDVAGDVKRANPNDAAALAGLLRDAVSAFGTCLTAAEAAIATAKADRDAARHEVAALKAQIAGASNPHGSRPVAPVFGGWSPELQAQYDYMRETETP